MSRDAVRDGGTIPSMTRRDFLRVSAAAGGGLLASIAWPGMPFAAGANGPVALGTWVRIDADGTVTIFAAVPEIGQGVRTSLPMILAEELRADWSRVRVEQAPGSLAFGVMAVGGSDSVHDYWDVLRKAGAQVRERLVAAAAARWGVEPSACRAENGEVVHAASGRTLGYGALAADAAAIAEPESPPLTDPADFRIVGTRRLRVDAPEIVEGRAVYGIDVRVPGMRFAAIARPPVHGGTVRRFDAARAEAIPGVERVIAIEPFMRGTFRYGAVRGGVAVIARDSWSAMRGRDALEIEWDDGRWAAENTEAIHARLRAARARPPVTVLRDEGDVDAALAGAARTLEADYELPLIAHGCLEPVNFTAHVQAGRCDLWGPTQHPIQALVLIQRILGLPDGAVHVHPTHEGGGFGRRLAVDYAVEAALVSRAAGVPVQVLWSREDDLRHDFYRTPSAHRLRAGLDAGGRVVAWSHQFATAPLLEHIMGPGQAHPEVYDVEGAANLPYVIPNLRVAYSPVDVGVQMGSWRSVANSFNCFAVCSFVDEIAKATGGDTLELLRTLLGPPRQTGVTLDLPERHGQPTWDTGRIRRVLDLAAERAGWGQPLPPGRGRGIACGFFKETCHAHVAEVSVGADRRVRVHRIVAALDCGRVVHPDGVEAQIEGAAMDGVASVLHWGITLDRGRVREGNFDAYRLLRMDEAPDVEAHLVPSDAPPSGTGEPPYPSVAPAICNAIFAASGVRVRRLPLEDGRVAAG